MSDDMLDVKIFEIVYNKHSNESMEFIQEEALKMQIAMRQNKMYLKQLTQNQQMQQCTPNFKQPTSFRQPSFEQPSQPTPPTQPTISTEQKKSNINATGIRDISKWKISDPEEMRNSIGDDEIKCCICHNESQHFKTLNRHLRGAHGIEPEEYAALCGISQDMPLMAKNFRQAAAKRIRLNAEKALQNTTQQVVPPQNATTQSATSQNTTQHVVPPQNSTPPQSDEMNINMSINPPFPTTDIFTQA